jgi:hypothetical protein
MAGEITEVTREPMRRGLIMIRFIYLYELNPPIEIRRGVNLVVTSPETLDPFISTNLIITQDEIDELAAGTKVFLMDPIEQKQGQTIPQMIALSKRRYRDEGVRFLRDIRARYRNSGNRYDKIVS